MIIDLDLEEVKRLFRNSFLSLEKKNGGIWGEVGAGVWEGNAERDAELISSILNERVRYEFNGRPHDVFSYPKTRGFFVGKLADLDDEREREIRNHELKLQSIENEKKRYKRIQELTSK